MRKFAILTVIFYVMALAFYNFVLAVNPPAPFTPDDNIQDPDCSPNDSNCYVTVSAGGNTIYTGDGNITSGEERTVGVYGDDDGTYLTFITKPDESNIGSTYIRLGSESPYGYIDFHSSLEDNSESVHFNFSADDVSFIDGRAVKLGIQYNGDYSADFTDRSLVDKGYVDSVSGGPTIYSADGTLSGNRAVDLDGNSLSFQQGGNTLLSIDPTVNNEQTSLRAWNITGADNIGRIYFNTKDTEVEATMAASFNDGVKEASVTAFADDTTSTLTYTADTHTFNGGDLTLSSLAGNGDGFVAVDNNGLLSWTATATSVWNTISSPTGTQSLTFDDGELNSWTVNSNTETFHTITANSLTTGKVLSIASSSLTSGSLIDLAITGTAAASNQKGINVSLSGANAVDSQTTYGIYASNNHTGNDTQNYGVYGSASGNTCSSDTCAGVWGDGSAGVTGVLGLSQSGVGVYGNSASYIAIFGYGQSADPLKPAIEGLNSDGVGVIGQTVNGTGVIGDAGSYGPGTNGVGVLGRNVNTSGTGYGVQGITTGAKTTGVAGYFTATGATNNYGIIVENGSVGIGTTSPSTLLHTVASTANTATVQNVLTIAANSTGTAAASFGTGILFQGESSTTNDRDMANIEAIWTDAADATRTSAFVIKNVTDGVSYETVRFSVNPTIATMSSSSKTLSLQGANIVLTPSGTNSVVTGNATFTGSTTTKEEFRFNNTYNNSSGTLTATGIALDETFNLTGSATGTIRGIDINPTLTALNTATYRGIDIQANHASAFGIYQSGSSTLNYFAGNTGLGDASPLALLTVGSGDLFQVASDGSIDAITGYIQGSGTMSLTSANTTQTTSSSIFALNANSLTSGTGLYLASSSLTSGSLVDLAITGTGAVDFQKGVNASLSGANGTGSQTSYGFYASNTHTGTNPHNYGLYGTVSNGSTVSAGVWGDNNGSGYGTAGVSTSGIGVNGSSTSGYGIYGSTTSGIAGGFQVNPSSTNTIVGVIGVNRFSSGTVAAGIGGSIVFNVEDDSAPAYEANTLVSKWTDVAHATRTSEFSITGVNSGTTGTLLTISGNGSTGIGDTTPDYRLDVENTGIDNYIFALKDSDGECLHDPEAGAETVTCSSDERLKTNINDSEDVLEYLNSFRIRNYDVISSGNNMTGVVAQEVLENHPELVSQLSNGMYSVQLPNQWKLVKGIQELDIKLQDISDFDQPDNSFGEKLRVWFANSTNKITRIFTAEVCLAEEGEETVCLNRSELKSLKDLLNQSANVSNSSEEEENNPSEESTEGNVEDINSEETVEENAPIEEIPEEAEQLEDIPLEPVIP